MATRILDKAVAFGKMMFPGFQSDNPRDNSAFINDAPLHSPLGPHASAKTNAELDMLGVEGAPLERDERYALYAEMSFDPIIDEALTIHITHALSTCKLTGRAVWLDCDDPEYEALAEELNNELMPKINAKIADWAKTMATYGVNYVRPHAQEKLGITHIECSYYTLPHFIREYERAGLAAGYTSQHLKNKNASGAIQLAPPWTLVPFKIPFHQPHPHLVPQHSGIEYSLFDDVMAQQICETQDYGHSFLANSYRPYRDLLAAIDSLRGSRANASRIDRLIALGMEDLDPIAAADYANIVAKNLKANTEAQERKAILKKLRPLIVNTLIPVHAGGKGGLTIDTQRVDPNISDIEDILFHLRRLASSLGIDASMLGWADMLSGGLGEGGFFMTSIQATRRAEWIRQGVVNGVQGLIDLHLWYKHRKMFPAATKRPWTIKLAGQNTALEEAAADAMESNASRSMLIAQLADAIASGAAKNSPELVEMLFAPVLPADPEKLKRVVKQLLSAAEDDAPPDNENLLSSLNSNPDLDKFLSSYGPDQQTLLLQQVMQKLLLPAGENE